MRTASIALIAALLAALALAPDAWAQKKEQEVPSEDALWTAAGQAFAHGEDKSAAMQQYRLFVNTYRKSDRAARAQYMLAECYFAIGDYETAKDEYARVEKFKGRDEHLETSVLLRTGECWFNLREFEQAIEAYSRLIDRHEDSFLVAEALFEVGLAYIADGNWLKLKAAYRRLLETRPGYETRPPVQFALGLFAFHDGDFDAALEHFAQVPSDRGLYYMGKTLEDQGQYILAIQRYRQVLRQFPESPLTDDVAFSIAEAFYRSGQNAVAVRSYRSFIEENPDSPFLPNARYKLACITYSEGDFDESIRQLEEVCQAFPGEMVCAYARYLIGDAYMQLGRTAEAIFAWTEVVKQFGESSVASAALHKMVYAYAHDENFGQVVQMAEEFVRRFPGDSLAPRVQVLKGYAHLELEEKDEAIRAFQNVLDKNVNTEVAERALFLSALAYSNSGQHDRLITNYNFIASRLLPTPSHWRARTYYYLAEAYYEQGLYKAANGMYRLVLTGYPRSNVAAAALQGLVASYSQMGEYELALQEQDEFLRALANADSEEGTNSLAVGSIYFNQRKYEDALRQYRDFLAAHPDDPEAAVALLNSGDCYYRLQYYEQAIGAWNDVLARFPESDSVEEAIYRIADTQFGLGQFDQARNSYRRLTQAFPEGEHSADAAFGLANCAYNLGEDQAAIDSFSAFVEAYPRDVRVEDAELGIQSCYYRSGRDMTEYLSRNPDSALAADVFWNQGQEAFGAGDFASAATNFEKVTLDYPESESGPGALFYLAESYYRMDQLEPSLAGFRNFTTTHPDHDLAELARFRTGTVLFRQENYEHSAREYEVLRDRFPSGEYAPLALFNAAICYQQIEDWTAAIANYEGFLQQYPTHEKASGLWTEIAVIYQDEIGAWDSAIEAWDRALGAAEGADTEIRYRQGECHRKAGRLDQAVDSFRAAGGGSGDDPFAIAGLTEMGELLEDRGEWEAAIAAYERIVQKASKPEWTAMAQGRVDAIREMQTAGR